MNLQNYSLLFILGAGLLRADLPASSAPPTSATAASSAVMLDPVTINGQLDRERASILPELGATSFMITSDEIQNLSQGANAPFNQVLLRAPGVAEDSAANGDLHVRGEHANLQYRINDVLLPEGISGFGLELDSRFADSVQLITGSLPAQYGFRTAGVVEIKTKSGTLDPGGQISLYGGSFGTLRPSVEAGGTAGNVTAYADASYDRNDLGIENPTSSSKAIHDRTDQSKAFVYLTDVLDPTSRLSFIGSASDSKFQVPNTPGLNPGTSPNGSQWLPGAFDSAALNERQTEQNYYGVVAYQKSAGNLNYQVSGFARTSSVHFLPDPVGDLYFNGVSSDVARKLNSLGLQADGSYALGTQHTLRGGVFLLSEQVTANSATEVFPVDDNGDASGPAFSVIDNHHLYGLFTGVYLQDEWKLLPGLTLNYGGRFDVFQASFDHEHQFSPRVNLVDQLTPSTTVHAGYSRYFTPPPVENVSGATVAKFNGTSNASAITQDDPVKAERSNYFDAGITQRIGSAFQIGLDGYYKRAKNQLDDGLFGQTLILSAFNYAEGKVFGAELTASYAQGGFSAYANLARSDAKGKNWTSSEFLFNPDELAYVQNHWIHLDHDQRLTGSFGTAYHWTEGSAGTRVYADLLYGTGLRTSATAADGSTIPNGGTVPSYVTANVGIEQTFRFNAHQLWAVRLDVVNLADKSYELRDGSGVGVGASQYGMRRGFFGSVSWRY